jgi:hypothetical protein
MGRATVKGRYGKEAFWEALLKKYLEWLEKVASYQRYCHHRAL